MKRILGIGAALMLMSSLLSSVLTAEPLGSQSLGDATLTIDRNETSPGIWKWTYTLIYRDSAYYVDSFNAQLAVYDGGAVPGSGIWGYAVQSDTGYPTPTYNNPPDKFVRTTWNGTLTKIIWSWAPPANSVITFGMKKFSLDTTYTDVGQGLYNLYLYDESGGSNQHGFAMATPIPEPGSLAMLGLVAIGLAGVRRKSR